VGVLAVEVCARGRLAGIEIRDHRVDATVALVALRDVELSLERHGGRTLTELVGRIARRLLTLTACLLHNWCSTSPAAWTGSPGPTRPRSGSTYCTRPPGPSSSLQYYPGDAVGMVSFDHNAHPGAAITQYTGSPFDLLAVSNAIAACSPKGRRRSGALARGRSSLNPVTGRFDVP
jgi:hypothetical protein